MLKDCTIYRVRTDLESYQLDQDLQDLIEVPLPLTPIAANQMAWEERDGVGIGKGEGADPYLVFALKEPRFVRAVRLKCSYENTASPAIFHAFWRRRDRNEFVEAERYVTMRVEASSAERTVTLWVNDTIDEIRIDPDVKPCIIRISEAKLLVPAPLPYEQLVRQVQAVAQSALPPQATVIVASHGDDELLRLGGRAGWHFPQTEEGVYTRERPADSRGAIAHLEKLRSKGGQYLIFPRTTFWWLEHYQEFRQHLEANYRVVVRQEDVCLIFSLREAERDQPVRPTADPDAGSLDLVDNAQVGGWAWDKNQPDAPVRVAIYDGDSLLAIVEANLFRKDLRDAGMGNGKHGFSYEIPDRLKDGKPHTIRVRISETNVELLGSPRTITLRAN
jgi:hypothetical protein